MWLSIILQQDGANPRVSGILFKAVVQAVLISGSETWMMIPRMGREIGGFQHRVAIWVTVSQPLRFMDVSWYYPPLEEAI